MDKKKINKMLIKLKFKAFTLKEKGQLPSLLVNQIMKLGNDTPKEVYDYYIKCTEDSMRLLGYYHRNKDMELIINKSVKELLQSKGYYLD